MSHLLRVPCGINRRLISHHAIDPTIQNKVVTSIRCDMLLPPRSVCQWFKECPEICSNHRDYRTGLGLTVNASLEKMRKTTTVASFFGEGGVGSRRGGLLFRHLEKNERFKQEQEIFAVSYESYSQQKDTLSTN